MKCLLPAAVFDQHIIVLGKTRSGKSSAMRYLVEHLLEQERPVCIVDPKGDWWGLKASQDGKSAGYPVVIFGGEHADVPLNARSGAAVAELLATGNRSAIVDLGGWMPGERTQFWIDFASTYFRTHRGRRWLVVDEVHNFCFKGKVLSPDAGKMLHWANRLASEGLGKGISMLAASQRPQKVHNDFLTSCETLIAMRVIHAADRGALADWIDGCGDEEQGKELIASIAQMKRGEAWVWSPEAEFGPQRLQFPLFKTYDSFKPQGAHQAKLSGWAEVDLGEVRKKLDAAVKEAEANDPAKLKEQIRKLKSETLMLQVKVASRDAAMRAAAGKPDAEDKGFIPDLHRQIREWKKYAAPLRLALEEVMKVLVRVNAVGFEDSAIKPEQVEEVLKATANEIAKLAKASLKKRADEFEVLKRETNRLMAKVQRLLSDENLKVSVEVRHNEPFTVKPRPVPQTLTRPERGMVPKSGENGSGKLRDGAERMLAALAQWHPNGMRLNQMRAHAGLKKSGTFSAYMSDLRRNEYIREEGDMAFATDAGLEYCQHVPAAPQSTEEVLAVWKPKLRDGACRMLDVLVSAGGEPISKEELGERAELRKSGTFSAYLGDLKTARLAIVHRDGSVAADRETLFL